MTGIIHKCFTPLPTQEPPLWLDAFRAIIDNQLSTILIGTPDKIVTAEEAKSYYTAFKASIRYKKFTKSDFSDRFEKEIAKQESARSNQENLLSSLIKSHNNILIKLRACTPNTMQFNDLTDKMTTIDNDIMNCRTSITHHTTDITILKDAYSNFKSENQKGHIQTMTKEEYIALVSGTYSTRITAIKDPSSADDSHGGD